MLLCVFRVNNQFCDEKCQAYVQLVVQYEIMVYGNTNMHTGWVDKATIFVALVIIRSKDLISFACCSS